MVNLKMVNSVDKLDKAWLNDILGYSAPIPAVKALGLKKPSPNKLILCFLFDQANVQNY